LSAQQNAPEFDPNCNCVIPSAKSPEHVYHGHEQFCSGMYLTDINYILELYSDSTFRIGIYHFNSLLSSMDRQSFCGKYEVINDTIYTKYFSSSLQTEKDIAPHKPSVDFRFYRPSTLVISGNSIIANEVVVPQLVEITLPELKELHANLQSGTVKKPEFISIEKRLEHPELYSSQRAAVLKLLSR
jgi:hypothetical protein